MSIKEIKEILKIIKNDIEYIKSLPINMLQKIIEYAKDKYYNTSKPIISDAIYDVIEEVLKNKLKDDNLADVTVGAMVKSDKVKLEYWLGSLDKIRYNTNDLDIWTDKYSPPYIIADKIDGVSALVIYNYQFNKINMYTRGDGEYGKDISHLVKYFNLPSIGDVCDLLVSFNSASSSKIAFRGEITIDEKVFIDKWSKTFKNSRNMISGIVNSKKSIGDVGKDVSLVMYEIIHPTMKYESQLIALDRLGFNCVKFKKINKSIGGIDGFDILSNYFDKRKKNSVYKIDGIVITTTNNYVRNTSGNPDYTISYKCSSYVDFESTCVTGIEWNISKNGLIIPTILVEPVDIGGVTIKRTSGFNARYILENKIIVGTQVILIRSGDVIPYIKEVVMTDDSDRDVNIINVSFPHDVKWIWSKSGNDIVVNENNDAYNIKNIYHFFTVLKSKHFGLKTVEKLYNEGFDTIFKILNLQFNDLIKIKSFKDKMANNILDSIKEIKKNIPLHKLMYASNKLGNGIGEERIKQILNCIPDIVSNYIKYDIEYLYDKVMHINGWNDTLSRIFVYNLEHYIKFHKEIEKFVTITNYTNNINSNNSKLVFVFSGWRDADIKNKLELMGHCVINTINKNVSYVVINTTTDKSTNKITKARELDIKIITKTALINMFNL